MLAYHSNIKIKTKYLKRIRAHMKADEIVKGIYWTGGKGCAIGCTIHGSTHKDYESELGIPEWLARVEDCIFEGLPNDKAKKWPQEFLKAIPVGKDLNHVVVPFVIFLLEFNLNNFDQKKYSDVKAAIETCIDLYRKGNLNPSAAWSAAESAAKSAAWSTARSTAEFVAWSAARSAAYVKFANKLLELLKECK